MKPEKNERETGKSEVVRDEYCLMKSDSFQQGDSSIRQAYDDIKIR